MKDIRKMDKFLLVLIIIYSVLGLIMILSASSVSTVLRYHVSSYHFFIRQLAALIVAYLIGFFILFIPTKRYGFLSYLAVFGVIGLLVLVLIYGKITNNAQSWFKIGPFTLQPSEFAKTVIIIFMAVFYNILTERRNKNLSLYFIPITVAAIMAFLIAKQPDLGSAAIFTLIAGFIFITVPLIHHNFNKIIKIFVVLGIILGGILVYKSDSLLTNERLSRFNFKNPCSRYREDSGYQVCNGLIAISNGGLWGTGLGKSTQKYMYLPESHTDFIFPIVCEELGAVFGALIIIGYGIILLRIYRIAKSADNLRTSIIAYGAFWYFALHIIINLLGILALIPLTGVPLPFLSYGGSYTLNAIVLIFVVERVSIENKKNKLIREIAKI